MRCVRRLRRAAPEAQELRGKDAGNLATALFGLLTYPRKV